MLFKKHTHINDLLQWYLVQFEPGLYYGFALEKLSKLILAKTKWMKNGHLKVHTQSTMRSIHIYLKALLLFFFLSIKLLQKIALEYNYQNLLVTVEKQIHTMNH